jgi:hypothetical protein
MARGDNKLGVLIYLPPPSFFPRGEMEGPRQSATAKFRRRGDSAVADSRTRATRLRAAVCGTLPAMANRAVHHRPAACARRLAPRMLPVHGSTHRGTALLNESRADVG